MPPPAQLIVSECGAVSRSHLIGVERTLALLAGCRRLHRRHERKADHFLAFADVACTLTYYRRLARQA